MSEPDTTVSHRLVEPVLLSIETSGEAAVIDLALEKWVATLRSQLEMAAALHMDMSDRRDAYIDMIATAERINLRLREATNVAKSQAIEEGRPWVAEEG